MGTRAAKCIEVPSLVFNIGLLYAFLLTVSHLLAWVTIARHEKTIADLKEIMVISNQEQKRQPLTAETVGNDNKNMEYTEDGSDVMKLVAGEGTSQRPRRHLDSNSKKNNTQHYLNGVKGDKGEKGDKGVQGDQGKHGRDGRDGRTGLQGIRGERGDTGIQGPRGYQGPQGITGPQGSQGQKGVQGEKGSTGSDGLQGTKGDRGNNGPAGKVVKHLHSAHIVASGKAIKSETGNKVMNPRVKWRAQHKSGKMRYHNGYLTIGMDGVYFIYSQMFYYDGTSSYIGYEVFIDDRKILKAVHSVPSKTRKYQTQYTSGIFEISKGQRISVAAPFAKYFYFNETLSFFGAFMLHEKLN